MLALSIHACTSIRLVFLLPVKGHTFRCYQLWVLHLAAFKTLSTLSPILPSNKHYAASLPSEAPRGGEAFLFLVIVSHLAIRTVKYVGFFPVNCYSTFIDT